MPVNAREFACWNINYFFAIRHVYRTLERIGLDELNAIREACVLAENMRSGVFWLHSTECRPLKIYRTNNYRPDDHIFSTRSSNCSSSFRVPAHCGISGNKAGDSAATLATRSDVVSTITGNLDRFCHTIVPKVSRTTWHAKFDDPLERGVPRVTLIGSISIISFM